MTDPVEDPERRQMGWSTSDHFPKGKSEYKYLDGATDKEWIEYQRANKKEYKTPKEIAMGNDAVNHPKHYTSRTMEAIDIIEMIIATEKNPKVAYNLSNVLKYLLRFREKGKSVEDLNKARWYFNRMINHVENE